MDEISRTDIPDESRLSELSDFFRIFGDQTRLRILYALAKSSYQAKGYFEKSI